MIRFVFRWLRRAFLALLVVVLGLLAPVAWNHVQCVGDTRPDSYAAILPEEHHRAEARTLMTYPEWHIVHAYDDYARVIAEGDPHDFGFLHAISGFWSSLCALSQAAGDHGGANGVIMQTVYTIGVSFTAEMLAKAAYEETLGRVATFLRGETRAPLDDLSAKQAAGYAAFLQQVPWYKWDFEADRAALIEARTDAFRDQERAIALGLEYSAKAAYARAIEAAVAAVGDDALTLRMIVTGMSEEDLSAIDGVAVKGTRPEGIEVETPRYRELTRILERMAGQGAEFVEIAGNDDILFTALSDEIIPGALHSFDRQGYGDQRHLILVKAPDLADRLRGLEADGLRLEHIHDY